MRSRNACPELAEGPLLTNPDFTLVGFLPVPLPRTVLSLYTKPVPRFAERSVRANLGRKWSGLQHHTLREVGVMENRIGVDVPRPGGV